MKRILVVGPATIPYFEKLAKQYPDTLFIDYIAVYPQNNGSAIIEVVNMVDGVMFIEKTGTRRLSYEVACSMTGTEIYEVTDYPVKEEKEK